MLNYGTGNPRFIHSGTSLDFTPTTHCIMTKKEPRSEDITRFSQITTANKYFEIGSHLELSYRIYNLTKAQIDALEAVIGQTIKFYPHSDAGVSFDALVLNVQPKMEKNLAFLYYVDITVLSVNYFKFGTNLTLTSPNGSEVLQRNQVFNITWSSYGITGNVALELWKNGSKLSDIDTSEANDGSYAWTVPADATIGSDYQIKILNSTGYIYDLSDANFTIDYDGYYLPDGSDDKIDTPFTNTDTAMTFAMWIKPTDFLSQRYLFARWVDGVSPYSHNYFMLHIDGRISAWLEPGNSAEGFTGRFAGSTATGFTFTGGTDLVVVRFQYGAGGTSVCKATVNNVTKDITDDDDNLAGGIRLRYTDLDVCKRYYIGCRGVNNSNAFKGEMRDFMLFENYISDDDVAKLYAKDYANMASKPVGDSTLWYKMNDADAGSPWTDNTLDSSGNGNHGTPINITGATFFNQS